MTTEKKKCCPSILLYLLPVESCQPDASNFPFSIAQTPFEARLYPRSLAKVSPMITLKSGSVKILPLEELLSRTIHFFARQPRWVQVDIFGQPVIPPFYSHGRLALSFQKTSHLVAHWKKHRSREVGQPIASGLRRFRSSVSSTNLKIGIRRYKPFLRVGESGIEDSNRFCALENQVSKIQSTQAIFRVYIHFYTCKSF